MDSFIMRGRSKRNDIIQHSPLRPNYYISDSRIHGKGVFTGRIFRKGEPIEKAVNIFMNLQPYVNEHFGRWVNHSYSPTCVLRYSEHNQGWVVYAKDNLFSGVEITCNYNDTPDFIEKPKEWYK